MKEQRYSMWLQYSKLNTKLQYCDKNQPLMSANYQMPTIKIHREYEKRRRLAVG